VFAKLSIEKFNALSADWQSKVKSAVEKKYKYEHGTLEKMLTLHDWQKEFRAAGDEDKTITDVLMKQWEAQNAKYGGKCHAMCLSRPKGSYSVEKHFLTGIPLYRSSGVHLAFEYEGDGIIRYRIAGFREEWEGNGYGTPQLGERHLGGNGDVMMRLDPATVKY
jgi:hypothetical protein